VGFNVLRCNNFREVCLDHGKVPGPKISGTRP
jgi:hypothetical protein